MRISIHAPTRGATQQDNRLITFTSLFQFTPLREGRHALHVIPVVRFRISIHAPTRGATNFICLQRFAQIISIHAPTRGATSAVVIAALPRTEFQFTPLREGRRVHVRRFLIPGGIFQFTPLREGRPPPLRLPQSHRMISIHAPTRGATRLVPPFPSTYAFQFTPLREGRLSSGVCRSSPQRFQFTPLREGRQCNVAKACAAILFQFTPLREGRRIDCW